MRFRWHLISLAMVDLSLPISSAMNSTGVRLLHRCKKTARLPLIAKTSQFLTSAACRQPQALTPLQQMLALDIQATGLYSLCFQTPRSPLEDFLTSPRLL